MSPHLRCPHGPFGRATRFASHHATSRIARRCFLLLALAWPATAGATPPAWSFDFDPNIAADPGHVNKHLTDLANGLPGLPPDAGIVELAAGAVKLYFFDDIADMLVRARDSGPAILPKVVRQPKICVEHGNFAKPDLLSSGSWLCEVAEQAAMAPFETKKLNTCKHVEFPESYVYDHPTNIKPDIPMVSNWNTLISLIGEALTYVDYPEGLLPNNFMQTMRDLLAKLRYQTLKAQIAAQLKGYQEAVTKVQTDVLCFDQAKVPAFANSVKTMTAELKAVEQHLDAIYQAGLAQAAADRKAVENKGRLRVDLPYPALSDRERELLAIYVAGVSWRIRGGGLLSADHDQSLYRRLLYVQYPFQLIAELAGGAANAKDIGFQIFVDSSGGYYKWYDMGTDVGSNDKYSDLVEMTKRGKRGTTLSAPTLAARGYDIRPLVAGGLQMGLCYYYIWDELNTWTGKELLGFVLGENLNNTTLYPSHLMYFLEWPTATGEMCTGGALALGLVRTMLWGKAGGKVCNPDCTNKPCNADDGCGTPCTGACSGDAGVGPQPDAAILLDDAGNPRTDDAGNPMYAEAGVPNEDHPRNPGTGFTEAGSGCHVDSNTRGPLALVLVLLGLIGFRRRRR